MAGRGEGGGGKARGWAGRTRRTRGRTGGTRGTHRQGHAWRTGRTCGGRQDVWWAARRVRRARRVPGTPCKAGGHAMWAGRLDVGRAREWAGPGVRLDMLKGERRGARTCACACGRTCGRACLPARPPARTCPHHTVVAGGGGRGWQVVRGRADRPEGVREGRRGCCVA